MSASANNVVRLAASVTSQPSATQLRMLKSLGQPGHVWLVESTGQAKRKGERAFERTTVQACIERGWAQRKLVKGHWALVLTGKGATCVEAAKARQDGAPALRGASSGPATIMPGDA